MTNSTESAPIGDGGHEFLDLNGRQVHAFANRMTNLGFAHLTDLLLSMFKCGAWQRFQDGLGHYEFLPGEFDYFLTQQGVSREDVMNGVRDMSTKADLEAAMDERRTGEAGYRRYISQVRGDNPQRPGRPILPFGYTRAEAKYLVNDGTSTRSTEIPALGSSVRRWTRSGGVPARARSATLSPLERARRAALRLADDELEELAGAIKNEQGRRRRRAASATAPLPIDEDQLA